VGARRRRVKDLRRRTPQDGTLYEESFGHQLMKQKVILQHLGLRYEEYPCTTELVADRDTDGSNYNGSNSDSTTASARTLAEKEGD